MKTLQKKLQEALSRTRAWAKGESVEWPDESCNPPTEIAKGHRWLAGRIISYSEKIKPWPKNEQQVRLKSAIKRARRRLRFLKGVVHR